MITNEFSGKDMPCAPADTVPRGPGVDAAYQGCAIQGAGVNNLVVSGQDYLSTAYQYHRGDLWRNFGILVAFTVAYTGLSALFAEILQFSETSGGALLFKKGSTPRFSQPKGSKNDEEVGATLEPANSTRMTPTGGHQPLPISESDRIFTWKNLEYTVPYGREGGTRKLLDKVSGYAKPGVMVALMGASGAGKSTLLNTLSQRQKVGVITGDMLVDGKPLGPSFKRDTGFCEQMDLHDGTATIREALVFSAVLRQNSGTPMKEKLAYVDTVLDLLDLHDLQHAIISSLGVELRKRTTIGVELVAKPSLLLFLDEPTSGLDSQSSFSIIHFLKRLTAAGQAIVCTIHQPSSVLFEQFDMVLALNPGGRTFYFGEIGPGGQTIIDYFGARGAHCPPQKNVAEFILETAIKGTQQADGSWVDWNAEWQASDENAAVMTEIDRVAQAAAAAAASNEVENTSSGLNTEYAVPVWLQTAMLTQRMYRHYWRDSSYLYGKLFTSVIIGVFNGFTFWQAGQKQSITDMQDVMFSCFILIIIPSIIVNAVLPKFYSHMALWQARELPSRIYGWVAFCTAQILAEIPYAVMGAVVYWLLWYYPTGLPADSSTAGYVFLMTVLFFLYQASLGQWICAWAPNFTVISNVLDIP